MNDLQTQSAQHFNGSPLRIELAKMLGLVAPITMSSDQCAIWLASAEDALQDIRASEVAQVSMEVRRTVTRPSQIVPEIAKLVAEMRGRRAKEREWAARPPLPPPAPPQKLPPMSQADLNAMPKWLRDVGLRVGYLEVRDGKLHEKATS